MSNRNNLTTGITELLVLSMLDKGDSYVYDITKKIKEYSNNLLSISQNTVYTVVYKLKEDKMIMEYPKLVGKRRTRIYYHMEPSGKEYLSALSENYKNMVAGVQNVYAVLEKGKEANE